MVEVAKQAGKSTGCGEAVQLGMYKWMRIERVREDGGSKSSLDCKRGQLGWAAEAGSFTSRAGNPPSFLKRVEACF